MLHLKALKIEVASVNGTWIYNLFAKRFKRNQVKQCIYTDMRLEPISFTTKKCFNTDSKHGTTCPAASATNDRDDYPLSPCFLILMNQA